MAETPIQHARVDQALWDAAKARAKREGRKLPVVLRHLLAAYVSGGLVVDIEGRIAILQPEQVEELERRARAADG
ncbi:MULTISPECIES: hypothetical protein [unclassified Nocardiopsis]|uniref:hypothetical protein n=1 Tax=unclassified Nocardiopsis TaxID=2649073 RepID=UPI001357316B|nr:MULTISPECIES: hypothetical protein [unclassified Nocardiopsis]